MVSRQLILIIGYFLHQNDIDSLLKTITLYEYLDSYLWFSFLSYAKNTPFSIHH
jgi:DNA polymerase sigma